jgi:hypothetical protein
MYRRGKSVKRSDFLDGILQVNLREQERIDCPGCPIEGEPWQS